MSDLQTHQNEQAVSLRQAGQVLGATPWTHPLTLPVPGWLVPGLLQREAIHVLTSESGACKSWLGLSLLLSGIYGTPVLGQEPAQRFSSLYLAADSPQWDIGQQLRKLLRARDLRPDPEPTSFIMPLGFLFEQKNHITAITDLVKAWDINAFFLDVMLYTHTANENDNGEMARTVLRTAKWLRDELGLAIFFLHHNAKAVPGMPPGFRGAGTIIQAAEHHYALQPYPDFIRLFVKKIRGDKILPPSLDFQLVPSLEGCELQRLGAGAAAPSSTTASLQAVAAAAETPAALLGPLTSQVEQWLAAGPLSRASLRSIAVGEGHSIRWLDNQLQRLRRQSRITQLRKGLWSTPCSSVSSS